MVASLFQRAPADQCSVGVLGQAEPAIWLVRPAFLGSFWDAKYRRCGSVGLGFRNRRSVIYMGAELQKEQLDCGTGCVRADCPTQGNSDAKKQSRHKHPPNRANRYLHGHTIVGVRPTRRLMGWTPRQRRYGTLPKIRHPALAPAISRKRPCLTGPGLHRKSSGKPTVIETPHLRADPEG